MIKHVKGDLLDYYERGEIDVLGHVCNCQNVMSSGVALQIKNKYPYAYKAYVEYDTVYGLELGTVSWGFDGDKAIANLHAQDDYGRGRRQLDYEAFYKCLEEVKGMMLHKKYKTVGFPYLIGSDRAGGDFRIVLAMIEVVFEDMDVLIVEWDKNKN
jgi:O-acetyl-ADP-ribose deacetylase (regulator of RNase III)